MNNIYTNTVPRSGFHFELFQQHSAHLSSLRAAADARMDCMQNPFFSACKTPECSTVVPAIGESGLKELTRIAFDGTQIPRAYLRETAMKIVSSFNWILVRWSFLRVRPARYDFGWKQRQAEVRGPSRGRGGLLPLEECLGPR